MTSGSPPYSLLYKRMVRCHSRAWAKVHLGGNPIGTCGVAQVAFAGVLLRPSALRPIVTSKQWRLFQL
jgi:hypothetical protein